MIKKSFPFVSGSSYHMNVLLTSNSLDYGFFDTYEGEYYSGSTSLSGYSGSYTVTGTSSNRLPELRKYNSNPDYSIRYRTSTSPSTDGLNVGASTTTGSTKTLIYYIGGITYTNIETTSTTATTFTFTSTGLSTVNFENRPILKIEAKQNMAENPLIDSDVFIIRQELPVFENSVRLRAIGNLNQVSLYAGGNYFTIYENT